MDVISFILQGSVEEYWNSVLPGPCRATLGVFHGAGVALGRECGDKDQSMTYGSGPAML